MKTDSSRIIAVLITASIIRFWSLESLPFGVSLTEVKFGLYLSNFVGGFILNPFWIRVPFAITGVITLYLTYKLVLDVTSNKNSAFSVLLMMTFLPWHILESRIAGYGIPLLFVFLVTFIILYRLKYDFSKHVILIAALFILIFSFGLTKKSPNLEDNLSLQRNSLPSLGILYRRVFINKFTENFQEQKKVIFENIDFGNFFFKGHPNERWGTEEIQKLFIVLIPFLIIGLFQVPKNSGYFILYWSIASFSILLLSSNKYSDIDLPLLVPLSIIISYGINTFRKKSGIVKKIVFVLAVTLALFEFGTFGKEYLLGASESTFSPRKQIYSLLASEIRKNKRIGESVLVTTKLANSDSFLKFYLGDNLTRDFTFQEFNSKTLKGKSGIVVDILPYDPGPSEALFTDNGNTPNFINLINILDDSRARQKIYLFRLK